MNLPKIAIQLITFDRYELIQRVVKLLQELILYPPELITLYICDDCSPGNYVGRLQRLKLFKSPWKTVFISTEENGGWGHNVNNGMRQIKEEFIFFIEDDYLLTRSLDLYTGVALLQARKNIGMLRYRGTAGDHLIYHQFEADISEFLPVDHMHMDSAGSLPNRVTYLQLDSGSPGLYVYSHGAHLKRSSFHRVHGDYDEGLKLGLTEESYAHRVKDRMRNSPNDTPAIAILPEWIPMHFEHVGISYQHTDLDK